MSTVMNPTGPEEPSVYWRRRLLVGLGALVILIIFFLILRSCSSDPAPTAAPAPTAPAPAPSTSESATLEGQCADDDIKVTIQPKDGTEFPTGTPITFTMMIENTSDESCERNVGTKPNTVLVESDGQQVWSSDDCGQPGVDDIKTIEPGAAFQLEARWDQKQSQSGCPAGQPTAPSGSYEVVGVNDQVKSAPSPFTIS